MAVTVTYDANVTIDEELETNVPAATSNKATITHDVYNTTHTIDVDSTVPATLSASFSQALTAGTATIDLTALTGTNGIAVDGTGLKVQVIKFKSPTANSATMEIDVGASNGYDLMGSGFEVHLLPGQEILFYGNDSAPDVGASDKTLDLVGTGTETLEVTIVMG